MRSFILAAAATFAACVLAAPGTPGSLLGLPLPGTRGRPCMSDADAQQVATNFKTLIASYSNELANSALTADFTDYSDSVITLMNSGCSGPVALGTPTFANRTAFEAGQGAQPPIPFEQLALWHTCDTVIIRWRSAQTPEEVTGVIVMETTPAPAADSRFPFLIKTVFSEFNSGAWLVNLDVFKPTCNGTAAGK